MGKIRKIPVTTRKKDNNPPITPSTKTIVNKEVKINLLKWIPLYMVSVKNDIMYGDNIIRIDHPKKCGHVTERVKGLYRNSRPPMDFPINLPLILDSFAKTSIRSKNPTIEI